jgi:hypothetical protein
VIPLKLHFRHTPDGYILTIKNKGDYYNQVISKNGLDTFEAMDSDTDDPITFTLIDHQGAAITLDNLQAAHSPISLRIKDKHYLGGVKIKGSPYIYLGKAEERSKITFILSILERKVPHTKN